MFVRYNTTLFARLYVTVMSPCLDITVETMSGIVVVFATAGDDERPDAKQNLFRFAHFSPTYTNSRTIAVSLKLPATA